MLKILSERKFISGGKPPDPQSIFPKKKWGANLNVTAFAVSYVNRTFGLFKAAGEVRPETLLKPLKR